MKYVVYWGNVIESDTPENAARAAVAAMCDPKQKGKWVHIEDADGKPCGDFDLSVVKPNGEGEA